jgi:hypothetical protein
MQHTDEEIRRAARAVEAFDQLMLRFAMSVNSAPLPTQPMPSRPQMTLCATPSQSHT